MNELSAVDGAERHDAVLSVLDFTGRVGRIEQVGGLTPLDGDAIGHGLPERFRGRGRESAQRCSGSSHVRIGRTAEVDG